MKYLLAIEGSEFYDLHKKRTDWQHKVSISQDVLDWLEQHDVEVAPDGSKIYIVNKVRYRFIGPVLKLKQFKDGTADTDL